MTSESEVLGVIQAYVEARTRNDREAVLSSYSEDWRDDKGYSKKTLRDWQLGSEVNGEKIDISVDLRTVDIVFSGQDGREATIGPVRIDSLKGRMTQSHTLNKEEDGVWRLTYSQTIDWEPFAMSDEMQLQKDLIDSTATIIRDHREQLLTDRWRPGYHFVVPEGVAVPFDPNGAIYWKGRYHLFYIFQDKRIGKKSDHWGHVSSTDLFHWRHHPTGLLEGMYSGNCFINEYGVPTICYHQVGKGNALAVALDDNLDQWKKLDTNPITPLGESVQKGQEDYRSWDPFAWYEKENYYAIFGGEHPAIAKSTTMEGQWSYVGDLFAHGVEGVDANEDVSCPELFRLGEKDVLLCISHRMGCRYYIGEWKNEQFYPEIHRQMSWADNGFFAPESLEDDRGRRIMWAWLLDSPELGVRFDNGWSGTMGLPRVISFADGSTDSSELNIEVPQEIENLRYRPFRIEQVEIPADTDLFIDGVSGDSIELMIDMESHDASEFGVKVCVSEDKKEQTVISYDVERLGLKVDTTMSGPENASHGVEVGPFELGENETLKLRVFVDKSVVEVFANHRQAVTRRIYPSRADSLKVSFFAKGGDAQLNYMDSWHISPANPY